MLTFRTYFHDYTQRHLRVNCSCGYTRVSFEKINDNFPTRKNFQESREDNANLPKRN